MKAVIRAIKEKPHLPLWVLSALLLILFFIHIFILPENTIDINIHDTYYVIASAHLFLLFSLWFGCCALGYVILKRFKIAPNFWLAWLHLLISVLALPGMFFQDWFVSFYRDYEGPGFPINPYTTMLWDISFWAILLFLFAQSLYFINIFMTALKKGLFRER